MGLELVELVMAVEEEFTIEISAEDGGSMVTVGDLFEHIVREVASSGRSIGRDVLWARYEDVVVEQLGVRRKDVTPEAEFVRDLRCG